MADLGKPEEIGKVFSGTRKYLYQAFACAPGTLDWQGLECFG
ncbi:MAG: hypothetical protein Q7T65_05830 [Thiobacillus sp.]|nr:hypothetical protein [Thiobacillus sp.]